MLNYISRFHVLTTLVAVFGIGCDDTTDTTGMVGNGQANSMFGGNATGMSPTPGLQNNQPQNSGPDSQDNHRSGVVWTLRQRSLRPKTAPRWAPPAVSTRRRLSPTLQ